MPIAISADSPLGADNSRRLRLALFAALAIYLGGMAFLLMRGKTPLVLLGIGFPVALIIATQPRVLLYTFLLSVFVLYNVVPGLSLTIADVAALLLIFGALLDIFLNPAASRRLPPLFGNYVALLLALIVCAVAGYNVAISVHPLARVTLLFATFLAVYRLSAKIEVISLLKFYFWNCVIHSVVALVPFIQSGGRMRSFGLLSVAFDDYMMLALPLGVSFYLWSRRHNAAHYLLGSLVVALALIGTQSRAPIFFGLLGAAIVFIVSSRRARKWRQEAADNSPVARRGEDAVQRRVRTFFLTTLALGLLVIALKPDYLFGVLGRFQVLSTTHPAETFLLRLELWSTAWRTFLDHPLTGVGPGLFRYIGDIYPTLHLNDVDYYVHGLSAHNLFLHYLAETGLLGSTMLVALFVNQYRVAYRSWRKTDNSRSDGSQIGLYVLSILFLTTTFVESGWMWGEWGMLAALLFALIARSAEKTT